MAADIYANPDLTKKVRFQSGEKKEDEDGGKAENADNVTIYDNYCPKESGDCSTEDKQQIDEPSMRRNLRPTTVYVLLSALSFLLLTAVAVIAALVTFRIQDENLKANYNEMKSSNANLTTERDELQRGWNQLKKDNDLLRVSKDNLSKERDTLLERTERLSCPADWTKVGSGCFYVVALKTLRHYNNTELCQTHGAQLVAESSLREQTYLSEKVQPFWKTLKQWKKWWFRKWFQKTVIGRVFSSNGPLEGSPGDACLQTFQTLYFHPNLDNPINGDESCTDRYVICEKILE